MVRVCTWRETRGARLAEVTAPHNGWKDGWAGGCHPHGVPGGPAFNAARTNPGPSAGTSPQPREGTLRQQRLRAARPPLRLALREAQVQEPSKSNHGL